MKIALPRKTTTLATLVSPVIFSHYPDDDGPPTHYASGDLLHWLREIRYPAHRIELDPDFAAYCLRSRGIEPHRLRNMTPERLAQPVIFCKQPDNTYLLVDGHHRYVAAAQLGRRTLRGWLLPPEHWRPFVLQDAPHLPKDDVMQSFSGLF